jgi:hypothetical protein
MSEMYVYLDARTKQEVAEVHQYTRPNGTIGGHGKPDPKRVFEGGVEYKRKKGVKRDPPPKPNSGLALYRWLFNRWRVRTWQAIRCALLPRPTGPA